MGLDRAVEAILSQGGIWAALFIFSVALGSAVAIHLQGKLSQCWADRVIDKDALRDVIQAHSLLEQQRTSENAARIRAQEAMAQAAQLSAERIATLTAQVTALTAEINNLRIGGSR